MSQDLPLNGKVQDEFQSSGHRDSHEADSPERGHRILLRRPRYARGGHYVCVAFPSLRREDTVEAEGERANDLALRLGCQDRHEEKEKEVTLLTKILAQFFK